MLIFFPVFCVHDSKCAILYLRWLASPVALQQNPQQKLIDAENMANLLLANFKDALKTAGISEYQVTSSVQCDQVVGGAVHFTMFLYKADCKVYEIYMRIEEAHLNSLFNHVEKYRKK